MLLGSAAQLLLRVLWLVWLNKLRLGIPTGPRLRLWLLGWAKLRRGAWYGTRQLRLVLRLSPGIGTGQLLPSRLATPTSTLLLLLLLLRLDHPDLPVSVSPGPGNGTMCWRGTGC